MEKYILDALIERLYDYRAVYRNKDHGMILALIWLYVKTWNAYGEHIIEYKKYVKKTAFLYNDDLWTFEDKDMNAALVTMAYPKRGETRIEDSSTMEKAKELKDMILERFDNDFHKYYEWSLEIRDEMVMSFYLKADNSAIKIYSSVLKSLRKQCFVDVKCVALIVAVVHHIMQIKITALLNRLQK